MDRSFRINTKIGVDQSVNINLKQDVDLYEILSLKLKQESLYKLHSANYGVIVGRVLANDAFGVPNAKITVFIPLSETDELNNRIKALYPYKSVTDTDSRSVKFNALPNYKKFACHQAIGSFPKKQMVLDDDSILEVYDKYYKYSTVTNNAGDYMIFGVPTGNQTIHVDIDLSDIGILSQEPRDFIYKGYSINMFESPTQFKKSTNLDDLAQIYTENTSVNVYPLWGDKTSNEIAITRKDINIQYKFEPTCVFIGSVITDSSNNSIGYNCIPDKNVGSADQLTPSKGNIEMIRKTIDDTVEEFPIKGNQLIDGDGVWCYQIPMNLDYVGTDEYGNIVPTDNPKKGIPTRTRVRFRITLDDNEENLSSKHRARFLVPNNPDLYESNTWDEGDENYRYYPYLKPHVETDVIDTDKYYEFGTLTPDDCFRDLYWNKVYSIKSYIPRLQVSAYEKTDDYLAIKGVNKTGANGINPLPFNHLNLNVGIPAFFVLNNIYRGIYNFAKSWGWIKSYSVPYNIDAIRESVIEEMNGIGLDFYNDWLNGCLYFPTWHWRVTAKKINKNGDYEYESYFCQCKNNEENDSESKLFLYNNCSLMYENEDLVIKYNTDTNSKTGGTNIYTEDLYTQIPFGSKRFFSGVIKKNKNKDGADVFYYSFGDKIDDVKVKANNEKDTYKYARLFSTDIILLGSLKDCDIDGVPIVSNSIPSTTSNIPPMGRYKVNTRDENGEVEDDAEKYTYTESNIVSYNGMNWGQYWLDKSDIDTENGYGYIKGTGLFFSPGIKKESAIYEYGIWNFFSSKTIYNIVALSDIKTGPNAERICELGVSLDCDYKIAIERAKGTSWMDGLITEKEIEEHDSRGLFATLNHNKLIGEVENNTTGYKTYNLSYLYPTNFDGRLEEVASGYTNGYTLDNRNKDYLDFRFGSNKGGSFVTTRGVVGKNKNTSTGSDVGLGYVVEDGYIVFDKTDKRRRRHFYGHKGSEPYIMANYDENAEYPFVFPLYNNSFYFYFGINQGSTAIDKFYEQFYSNCVDNVESKYTLSIDTSASTVCDKDGAINIVVEDILAPYQISVLNSSGVEIMTTKCNDQKYCGNKATLFSDELPNGVYELVITTNDGNVTRDDIVLSYQKISLNAIVSRDILVEYLGQTKSYINDNDLYGKISVSSYTLYGVEYPISNLTTYGEPVISSDDKMVTFKLSQNNVILEMVSRNDDSITDYYNGTENNNIKIVKPGTFDFTVYELCKNSENIWEKSDNFSTFSISVNDTKSIELYINDIPLKYIVGLDRSTLPYNKYFHGNGSTVTDVTNESIKGWFGAHNPDIYSDIFKANLSNESSTELNVWLNEDGVDSKIDIISKKLKYMFDLSSAVYVTNNGTNKIYVDAKGGGGENLIRSGLPIYSDFSLNNTETAGTFNNFVTSERTEVTCNKYSPNIVSKNYCYVKDTMPENAGIISYAFNPKYNNTTNTAGNYFAAFSNEAAIVQLDNNTCVKDESIDYQSIPFNTNEISGLCLNGEEEILKPEVYTGNGTNTSRYFRTEFIDRRFDYDFIFITGRRTNHFDVNGVETASTWNLTRVSAVTYNGIEMLYDDRYNIVSKTGNTEYNYDYDVTSSLTVTLKDSNSTNYKKFYDSKLYYSNSEYVDLIDAYDSSYHTGIIDGCEHVMATDLQVNGDFGLNSNGNVTYPTIRTINFKNIPYGDKYTFTNVSCSYDNISIEQQGSNITAKVTRGDEASYTIDSSEIVSLVCNGFESDCANGKYNIGFTGSGTTLKSTKINELKFNINTTDAIGFRSKFGELGLRICKDNTGHTKMASAKTVTSYAALNNAFNETIWTATTSTDSFIDSEDVRNTEYVATGNIDSATKFLNVIFDRVYFSTAADSLTKKIRVINTSTMFNVGDFGFVYNEHTVVDDGSVIPGGTITFDVEASGDVPIPTPTPDPCECDDLEIIEVNNDNRELTRGGSNRAGETDNTEDIPITVTGSGAVEEDVDVTKQRDYTTFTFNNSKFLMYAMRDLCFNIDYAGETFNYKLGEGIRIISNSGTSIKIGVEWNKHKKLLSDETVAEPAKVKVYIKTVNNYKAVNNNGYLVFAFAFTTKGSGTTLTFTSI